MEEKNSKHCFFRKNGLKQALVYGIFPKLDTKALGQFAQTCQSARALSHPSLLLQGVLWGQEEAVKSILETNPELLFKKGTVVDYYGRTFKGFCALELALWAMDVRMLEMMLKVIDEKQLENGRENALKLFNRYFPKNASQDEETYDFSTLVKVINMHQNNLTDPKVEAALQNFRDFFKPCLVKLDSHYNLNNFINAHKVYYDYDCSNNWSKAQLKLFQCKVIGYIQRTFPALFAQIMCQAVDNIMMCQGVVNIKKLESGLSIGGRPYFPAGGFPPNAGLGFDFGNRLPFFDTSAFSWNRRVQTSILTAAMKRSVLRLTEPHFWTGFLNKVIKPAIAELRDNLQEAPIISRETQRACLSLNCVIF